MCALKDAPCGAAARGASAPHSKRKRGARHAGPLVLRARTRGGAHLGCAWRPRGERSGRSRRPGGALTAYFPNRRLKKPFFRGACLAAAGCELGSGRDALGTPVAGWELAADCV